MSIRETRREKRKNNDSKNIKREFTSRHLRELEDKNNNENLMNKLMSFGSSFFVGIAGIAVTTTILIVTLVYTTGLDVIPILEAIIGDNNTEHVLKVDTPIKGMDMSKDLISTEEFKTIHNRIHQDIGPHLLDTNLFNEGREMFDSKMNIFYSKEYISKTLSNDILYNTLRDIYSENHRYPYSLTMVSIGKAMVKEVPVTKVVLDINSVDDDLGFHIWNVVVFFNKKYEIQDVKVIGKDKKLENTRTPLDLELSLLDSSASNSLAKEVAKFMKDFNNKGLYEKIATNSSDMNTSQQKAFFSKLNIEQKSYDILGELFNSIQGNTSNISIVEYMNTDFDGYPLTNVVLAVKSNGEVFKYNLEFNRNEKQIVNLTKLS